MCLFIEVILNLELSFNGLQSPFCTCPAAVDSKKINYRNSCSWTCSVELANRLHLFRKINISDLKWRMHLNRTGASGGDINVNRNRETSPANVCKLWMSSLGLVRQFILSFSAFQIVAWKQPASCLLFWFSSRCILFYFSLISNNRGIHSI